MSLVIKLVRHCESEANTGKVATHEVGDHTIPLTSLGLGHARDIGKAIGREYLSGSLVYASPYRRTRETLAGILEGCGVSAKDLAGSYEDPRLREVEHGYEPIESQAELRRTHGWFYYRFRGGESPADCYDRTSSFLESMMRQVERKNAERVLIVTHGLAVRCFVMRFLHLSVEEFDVLANPHNGAIITLADKTTLESPLFENGYWGVSGLTLRSGDE